MKLRNFEILKEPFLGSKRSVGSDVFERKCESETALLPGANVELHELDAQPITVGIIANLGDRPLEKRPFDVVRKAESRAEPGFQPVAITDGCAQLVVGRLDRALTGEKIRNVSKGLAASEAPDDAGGPKHAVSGVVIDL
jgi:hypothetical protein